MAMKRAEWAALAVWVAGAAALALGAGAQAATREASANYKATMKQVNADYSAARAKCRTLSGHAKSVCIAEAKAALRKADAEALATYRDTDRARMEARKASVIADYTVDKAKCGDRTGEARKACLAEARERQSAAVKQGVQTGGGRATHAAGAPAVKTP